MGYVEPSADFDAAVSELRQAIRDATRSATTFGYGPALPALDRPAAQGRPADRALPAARPRLRRPTSRSPSADYGFTRLKHAQAIGDLETLRAHDLPAERVTLEGDDPAAALRALTERLRGLRVSAVAAAAAENPLVEGLERLPVHPTTLVIFGATGDLAKRKLLPALYNLAHEGALPERFNLVGVSRSEHAARGVPRRWRSEAIQRVLAARARRAVLERAARRASATCPGTFDDAVGLRHAGRDARRVRQGAPAQRMNRCFYLSTAPTFFPVIVGQLGEHKLCRHEGADVRVVIEKPFGTTLAEAEQLNREVLSVLDEQQVFRIDHYLGKETVQNMHGVPVRQRDVRARVEPQLHRPRPDHRRRGHRHRLARRLLRHGRRAARPDPEPHAPAAVPRRDGAAGQLHRRRGPQREGQGAAGHPRADPRSRSTRSRCARSTPRATSGGEHVAGYLEEEGVPADSNTETYAALRLEVDNWRWAGRAVLPAHRQAPGAQGHRDRGDAEARAPPRRSSRRARSACGPTS